MKKLTRILLVLILIGSIWLAIQKSPRLVQPKPENKKISINQEIDQPNAKSILNTYQAESGETALDLLKRTAEVNTKGDGVGAYVITINKITANAAKKEYWAFYINGKLAELGAGSYKLKEGDKIEWKIEKYQ